MRLVFLILLLMGTRNSWAQIEVEKSVITSFVAQNAEEAKPYLLHQAAKEAISQYSTELGFDFSEFTKQLDTKFSEYFETYKIRKFTEKFGKKYSTDLSDEQKKTFLTGLESQRDLNFIKFAELDQLLNSYAFKQVENDPAGPNLWKATIVLNLNRTKLLHLVSRLSSKVLKQYSKLKIISDINLTGLEWPDLGLESSQSFTNPMLSSWLKWLSSNPADNVEEVVGCSETCLFEFSQWQQLPQDEGMIVSENVLNNLWLKISFNLKKISYVENANEWRFIWDGRAVLLDANTKKILASYTMLSETKTFRNLDHKSLNSSLASSLYRSTLDTFARVVKKIQETPRLNRLNKFVVQGHKHLGDVISLMELLREKGANLNLDVQLDAFSQKEAQVLCFYQGEEKSFTDLLSRVKELKSSQSYRLVNEFTGIHQVLKLVAE